MNDRFSLLFFPKGNSISKDGKVSIYLRITVNVDRAGKVSHLRRMKVSIAK